MAGPPVQFWHLRHCDLSSLWWYLPAVRAVRQGGRRGFVVTDPEASGAPILAAGETAVEVPFALFEGLTISGLILYSTERGTVLVRGAAVTDPEALATLCLPVGEAAVEIHLNLPTSLTMQEMPA